MRSLWLMLGAALLVSAPARAVLPTSDSRDAARRFGRGSRVLSQATVPDDLKRSALRRYNSVHPSGVGRIGAASLGATVAPADVHAAARSFLSETQAALGIDPQQLELLRTTAGDGGHRHALYRQVYKGLPVDFSSVKVHFDGAGKVLDVSSNFRRNIDLDPRPDVAASVAAFTVKRDLGEDVRTDGQLVVVLDPKDARPRLAWKFKAERAGKWIYYVDAHTGELILRYDDQRHAACNPGDAQGAIRAMMFPYDGEHQPISAVPLQHEWVYYQNASNIAETDSLGRYCFPGTGPGGGKIFTFLQGPYIKVGNFRGQSAHYDNGGGSWGSLSTPQSSPHPYPNNANVNQVVDVTVSNPNVVALAPVFSNFAVGTISNGGTGEAADITDDDQVSIVDSSGNAAAFYVGTRASFTGTAVPGKRYTLRLRSNASGQSNGYDVASSLALTIPTPAGNGTQPVAFVSSGPAAGCAGNGDCTNGSFDWWPASYTVTNLRAEMALFYHLNRIHDYFVSGFTGNGGVDANGAAPLNSVEAMVLVGPNIVNAFYDPDYDDFAFGDNSAQAPSDIFTDDATVPHHEYTHFVVQKIWNIQNFGEAGAISEANADYFSASSLGYVCPDTTQGTACPAANRVPVASALSSSIGKSVNESLGNVGPLRELDSVKSGSSLYLGTALISGATAQAWTGEIHADSIFVSQSLWDMRKALVANGVSTPANWPVTAPWATSQDRAASCADQLQFQALLFFPESFAELVNALTEVDSVLDASGPGAAPACGGPIFAKIAKRPADFFAAHGLPMAGGGTNDPWDTTVAHNDGFDTATDISTMPAISATIYPAVDIDFYTFAAGPGMVNIELDLPPEGAYYSGYMITLYDYKHNQITQAMPSYDGINTDFGLCMQLDCTTSQSKVKLAYNNPTGQQLFVEISGGPTDVGGSNSGVHNTVPYILKTSFTRASALKSGIVSAQLDKDLISFTLQVTTWTSNQDYRFVYAQLRDQGQGVLPNTDAPALPGPAVTKYLAFVSSYNALGQITGTVQLANGFNGRFPSVGTVYLEVFGYDVQGSTVSLGLSNPLNLTTNVSDVHAWNNVFNPRNGQKTTVRYDLQSAGHLTIRLYTLNGLLVQTLFDGDVQAGKGSVDWAGVNTSGATVASGIYLLHVQGPGLSKTQKIAVIK